MHLSHKASQDKGRKLETRKSEDLGEICVIECVCDSSSCFLTVRVDYIISVAMRCATREHTSLSLCLEMFQDLIDEACALMYTALSLIVLTTVALHRHFIGCCFFLFFDEPITRKNVSHRLH